MAYFCKTTALISFGTLSMKKALLFLFLFVVIAQSNGMQDLEHGQGTNEEIDVEETIIHKDETIGNLHDAIKNPIQFTPEQVSAASEKLSIHEEGLKIYLKATTEPLKFLKEQINKALELRGHALLRFNSLPRMEDKKLLAAKKKVLTITNSLVCLLTEQIAECNSKLLAESSSKFKQSARSTNQAETIYAIKLNFTSHTLLLSLLDRDDPYSPKVKRDAKSLLASFGNYISLTQKMQFDAVSNRPPASDPEPSRVSKESQNRIKGTPVKTIMKGSQKKPVRIFDEENDIILKVLKKILEEK